MSSWIPLFPLLCLCLMNLCGLLQGRAMMCVLIEMYKQRTTIGHYAHPLLTGMHTPVIVVGSCMRQTPCHCMLLLKGSGACMLLQGW